MSSQVRLRLLPSARCFFDEPVQVKVSGLTSRQVVTIKARSTDERGGLFTSSATYRADGSGEIDLNRDPSLSGSYVGVEPMGLLRSLRADTSHRYFCKNRALDPLVVKVSVHAEEGRMLAEATNERVLMADGVSRIPVKEGNVCGVLFTPPGTVGGPRLQPELFYSRGVTHSFIPVHILTIATIKGPGYSLACSCLRTSLKMYLSKDTWNDETKNSWQKLL